MTAWDRPRNAVDRFDISSGGQQCITTLVHRRSSGMIGEPLDCDVPPIEPDDALDHADVDLLLIEPSALLNVKLDIGGKIARLADDTKKLVGIAAYGLARDQSPATVTNVSFASVHVLVLGTGIRVLLQRPRDRP